MESFRGNPNKTITAIDTGGGIACSRTSGQTPCFVHVSASAITATGSSKPYEDLEFRWDFGDAAGTESLRNPVIGRNVNPNASQTGPEAAYCYRSAGTYTITLTIRGKNGSSFVTSQITQDVVVSAFNASGGTYYFDSISGSDANNGLSQGAPKQSISALNTVLATANRAVYLKCGSNWVGSAGISVGALGIRIDAYGTGANPIVNINTGNIPAFWVFIGGSSLKLRSDIVISNVDLVRSGDATCALHSIAHSNSNVGTTCNDIYVDGCNYISDLSSGVGTTWMVWATGGPGVSKNFGVWGGAFTPTATDTSFLQTVPNGAVRQQGFFGTVYDWAFFVGFSMSGSGSNGTLDHHMYPDILSHALFRYIGFGESINRSFCINNNWDNEVDPPALNTVNYHLISDCNMTGTSRAFDAGNATNDVTKTAFQNYVVQSCLMHDFNSDSTILIPCATSLTMRDCIIYGIGGAGRCWAPDGPISAVYSVYRNMAHVSVAVVGTGQMWDWFNKDWSNAQTFTDNITIDERVDARAALFKTFSNMQSSGSIIDRNQWSIPNDADGKAWYDGVTARAFAAQWQGSGFDANGSVGALNLVNPAAGDFRMRSKTIQLTCV